MPVAKTPVLEIAYIELGEGPVVFLVHGWPDAARGWDAIRSGLVDAGHRVIVPSLRGSGATRFRDDQTVRDGTAPALAQDVLDLADHLGVERFAVVGHDWGARTAFTLAAVAPERLASITALALAFQPYGRFEMPDSFDEARLLWYQWLMYIDAGAEAIAADPVAFAREQWDTWSPAGWYDEEEFAATAASFTNPDWVAVTLNAYRTRFLAAEPLDLRYDEIRRRIAEVGHLCVPTLMVHGGADTCDPPVTSEGLDKHFDSYLRIVIDGAGHFPHREAPEVVLRTLIPHLAE
jgi:pimeloyl-ACP methyl ester carboxylesterase